MSVHPVVTARLLVVNKKKDWGFPQLTESPYTDNDMVKKQFESQLNEHWGQLKGLAISLLKDPTVADDVLQTSFVKAITTSSQPTDEDKLLPWFKTIIRNTALDVLRKKQQTNKKEVELIADLAVEDDTFNESVCDCVLALLSRLTPHDQSLLTALDVEGQSLDDLSKSMDVSKNALKVRRHRARKRLKSQVVKLCGPASDKGCSECDC